MTSSSDPKKQLADAREARAKAGRIAATGRTPEEREKAGAEYRRLGEQIAWMPGHEDDPAVLW